MIVAVVMPTTRLIMSRYLAYSLSRHFSSSHLPPALQLVHHFDFRISVFLVSFEKMGGPPGSQVAPLPSNLPFRLVSKTIGSGAYAS